MTVRSNAWLDSIISTANCIREEFELARWERMSRPKVSVALDTVRREELRCSGMHGLNEDDGPNFRAKQQPSFNVGLVTLKLRELKDLNRAHIELDRLQKPTELTWLLIKAKSDGLET